MQESPLPQTILATRTPGVLLGLRTCVVPMSIYLAPGVVFIQCRIEDAEQIRRAITTASTIVADTDCSQLVALHAQSSAPLWEALDSADITGAEVCRWKDSWEDWGEDWDAEHLMHPYLEHVVIYLPRREAESLHDDLGGERVAHYVTDPADWSVPVRGMDWSGGEWDLRWL